MIARIRILKHGDRDALDRFGSGHLRNIGEIFVLDRLKRAFGDLSFVSPPAPDGIGKVIGGLGNRDRLFGAEERGIEPHPKQKAGHSREKHLPYRSFSGYHIAPSVDGLIGSKRYHRNPDSSKQTAVPSVGT